MQITCILNFKVYCKWYGASQVVQWWEFACQCKRLKRWGVRCQEDPLEKEMAAHSSILAWKIPRTGESGRLQPAESQESDMTWTTEHENGTSGHVNLRSLMAIGWNQKSSAECFKRREILKKLILGNTKKEDLPPIIIKSIIWPGR